MSLPCTISLRAMQHYIKSRQVTSSPIESHQVPSSPIEAYQVPSSPVKSRQVPSKHDLPCLSTQRYLFRLSTYHSCTHSPSIHPSIHPSVRAYQPVPYVSHSPSLIPSPESLFLYPRSLILLSPLRFSYIFTSLISV